VRVHHVRQSHLVVTFGIEDPHREITTAVTVPMIAVNAGRSWNATEIGSRKKTGSSAAVAPARHQAQRDDDRQSTAVDAKSPHRGTGPLSTASNTNTAAAAYTPRITAYNPGSQ